jgi:hypothetical protein
MRFTLFQSFALVNAGEACVLAGRRIASVRALVIQLVAR